MTARQLDPRLIVETVELLSRRISERFPEAGLNRVCRELLSIASDSRQRAQAIGRPMLGVRLASATVILVIVVLFGLLIRAVRMPQSPLAAGEFVQVLEAAFNAVVLIGATILFLVTLENRVKRARAMKAIHELRSLAHLIDMHQLTKDPERTLLGGPDTKSSPRRTMTQFQLNRYLDYCCEMLSLTGKVAALYVENFPDPHAVAAVNDLEDLTSGLARKIWQKIMILHQCPPGGENTAELPSESASPSANQGAAAAAPEIS